MEHYSLKLGVGRYTVIRSSICREISYLHSSPSLKYYSWSSCVKLVIITIIIIHIITIIFITRPHIFNNPVQFPHRPRSPAKKEVEQVFLNDQMMNGRVKVGEGGFDETLVDRCWWWMWSMEMLRDSIGQGSCVLIFLSVLHFSYSMLQNILWNWERGLFDEIRFDDCWRWIWITAILNTEYWQGSTNCSILPSQMKEHGEHREGGDHGKDGKHQPDDFKHSIYD